MPQFPAHGIVAPGEREQFDRLLAGIRRLRDASLPWVLVAAAALAWAIGDSASRHEDAYAWALDADGSMGFGGWWYAYAVRPIFLALLLGWAWRLALIVLWFVRIGRLNLSLVPTHPDRVGGLGFLEKLPGAFSMVTLALSAVVSSHWAHEIVVHGTALADLKLPALVFVVGWTCVVLLPLFVLAPTLRAARREALAAYSGLVGEQGRLVHRRWILREPVESAPLLDAPEIGPVADANALFAAVKAMRPFPIGKSSVLAVALPLALPLLITAALKVPLKELLLKVAKTLL